MGNRHGLPATTLIMRLVRDYGRAHAPMYALGFVLMGVAAACTSFSAWLMKDLINTIFVAREVDAMMYFPALVSAVFITKGLVSYCQELTLARTGRQIVTDLRKRIYDHFLRMDHDFFRLHSSGELVTRMNYGAFSARKMIDLVALGLGRDGLTVFGLCLVMVWQDPIMFAMAVAATPVAALSLRKLSARARKAARGEAQLLAAVASLTRDTAQGAKMIKSFQLEDLMRKRLFAAVEDLERLANKIIQVKAAVAPLSEAVAGIAIGAVILYGTLRSGSDPEMPGRFFSFITALLLAGEPMRRLSRLRIELAAASVPVSMMYEMLDEEEREPAFDARPSLVVRSGEIRFENVFFKYGENPYVLEGLDLVLDGGKTTALVGHSGAGKTTIFNLILGLNLPTRGRILIDGTSNADVSVQSLRSQVALLDQEAFLFEGSIEDNIRGSMVEANFEGVSGAAKAADANEFINKLEEGYTGRIRELGGNLSGGQRQRIALARAFFKDAPILLLDEPTSALDSESERKFHESVKRLAGGRTTVIIAHRLSTVLHADKIYVISEGRAAECGTHAQLLAQNGLYAHLFQTQSGGLEVTHSARRSVART